MYKKISIAIIILAVLSIYILAQKEEIIEKAVISVSEVKEKIKNKEDIILLDVRTHEEYNGNLGHIDSTILIPVHELESRMDELEENKEEEIIVICRSGNRSGIATALLRTAGFNAFNMVGGMIAYRAMEKKSKKDNPKSEGNNNQN